MDILMKFIYMAVAGIGGAVVGFIALFVGCRIKSSCCKSGKNKENK